MPARKTVLPASRIAEYYRCAGVSQRLREYCGGQPMTATSIAGYGGIRGLCWPEGGPVAVALDEWPRLLAEGADVCRSLGDTGGTLLQIDLDYVNPDDPGEAYRDATACFHRLEPVHDAVREVLASYAISATALMTGRGYHYTTLVPTATWLHESLRRIGASARPGAAPVDAAHEGAGRLLEFLAHAVARRATATAEIPVTLADLPTTTGGGCACLDLSAYGDPLPQRHIRCAFSSNQKAAATGLAPGRGFSINLPRKDGCALDGLLLAREDPAASARIAAQSLAWIPETREAPRLLEDYLASPLASFHVWFDTGPELPRAIWAWTYDSLDTGAFPGCVALPLEQPNPLLLRPVYLRSVALALWAMGWHPRSVAGLVRSRFERDYNWGDQWERFDAAQRAAFYVRVFCGAVVGGLDGAFDFTCATQAARRICAERSCSTLGKALFRALGSTLGGGA